MTLAVIFNGQGAHYSEMGVDFAQTFPEAKEVYEEAEAITGYPINQWLTDDIELLQQTQYAQVAITATSLAIYESIKAQLPKVSYMAGLSLGEYTSLIASGMLSFDEGIRLNQKRGHLMSAQCKKLREVSDIGMIAVMKMPLEEIKDIISEVNADETILFLANINSSTQVTVAGTKEGLKQFKSLARDRGHKKIIPLKVEGPFHTPYMGAICKPFEEILTEVSFQQGTVPVISNTTVEPHTVEGVRSLLTRHLVEPVRWQETIDYFVDQGITKIIQIGPGKTLANLLKREENVPDVLVIDQVEDVEKIAGFIGG